MAYAETDRPAVGTRVRFVEKDDPFVKGEEAVVMRHEGRSTLMVRSASGYESYARTNRLEPLDTPAPPPAPSVTFGTGIGTLPRTAAQAERLRAAAAALCSIGLWTDLPEGSAFWSSIDDHLRALAVECERPEPAPEVSIKPGCGAVEVQAKVSPDSTQILIGFPGYGSIWTRTTPTEARALAAGLIALADHVEKTAG